MGRPPAQGFNMSYAEEYTCSLDESSLKVARDELNEIPSERLGAVETLRQWVMQQPHIKCPTDTAFLLAFLRARKFSQLEARRRLENYLNRTCSFGKWFQNLDGNDPNIHKVLDDGFFLILPGRDSLGRKVFFIRPGMLDVRFKKYSKDDMFRAFALCLESLYMLNETTQVHGTVTIMDMVGYTIQHTTHISMEDRKNFIQTWQKNFPARISAVHMYNIGAFFEIVMLLIKTIMSGKIQKRLINHGQVLEGIYKHVPMSMLPEEYLPDDYEGPNGGSVKQIIENTKAFLTRDTVAQRLAYLSSDKWFYKHDMKPTDIPQASFRKLNID